jgi:hypothetical protein
MHGFAADDCVVPACVIVIIITLDIHVLPIPRRTTSRPSTARSTYHSYFNCIFFDHNVTFKRFQNIILKL